MEVFGGINSSSETRPVETPDAETQRQSSRQPGLVKNGLPNVERIPFGDERSLAGDFDEIAEKAFQRSSESQRLGKVKDGPEPEREPVDQTVRPEYVQCALPGCGCVFIAQRYYGKTQRFCCDVHRQRMRTLLIHARWVYENTGCFFALVVLRYLEILCNGIPPP